MEDCINSQIWFCGTGLAPFGETKKKHLDNMFPISYR